MKSIISILFLIFLSSCTIKKKENICYLSSIENIKIFPANKTDSLAVQKIQVEQDKIIEKSKINKTQKVIYETCLDTFPANFINGGMHGFRIALFNNFKLPKNLKSGESRIRVTIDTNNKLEKIEFLNTTDEAMKIALKNLFKIKEIQFWESGKTYGILAKTEFEISFFINNE